MDIEKTTSYSGVKKYEILKNIIYNRFNRFNNDYQSNYINNNNPFNPIEIKKQFLTWHNNSCRLDSSFFYICIYFIWLY